MPFYFAYGSNMDRDAMGVRCPRSLPLGAGWLTGFRFVVTVDGYASISPEAASMVYGLIWHLDPRDEATLDDYEEVAGGLYTKTTQSVCTTGLDRQALVYVGQGSFPGEPRPGYMESVVAAAEACALPPGHLEELRRWLPRPGVAPESEPST